MNKAPDREVVIDRALLALLHLRNPRVMTTKLLERSRLHVIQGSRSYTLSLEGKPIARVDLNGNKQFTFTIL
jgi:hypothetical protein